MENNELTAEELTPGSITDFAFSAMDVERMELADVVATAAKRLTVTGAIEAYGQLQFEAGVVAGRGGRDAAVDFVHQFFQWRKLVEKNNLSIRTTGKVDRELTKQIRQCLPDLEALASKILRSERKGGEG